MTRQSRSLARAASIVMIAFVLSRALGLLREIVIGRQFGTSPELDAYLAAFRIPDFLFFLVAGGALSSAFIPTFTTYLTQQKEDEAWRLASAIMNLIAITVTLAAVVAAILAPFLVRFIIAPGFEPAQQRLTVELVRVMMISTVLFAISGLMMAILNSYQHFALPAFAPVAYNLAIIFGALVIAPLPGMGVRGLVVGLVIGAMLHLGIQLPALRWYRGAYWPVLGLAHSGVREVARLMGPRVLGLAAIQINFIVNTALASTLTEGSVAALNYAWLLMLLPQGIFAQAVATVAFPTFAEQAARGETAELRRTLSNILRLVLFLAIPASVGLYVLRIPLIQVLLQRGNFTLQSTIMTAWALQFYALGLFAHSTVEIVTRTYYALHDTRTPVGIGVGAVLLNIILSLALIGPLAHGGLALANSVATILEALVLILILRWRLGGLDGSRLLLALGRMALAAAVMGAIIIETMAALHGRSALVLVVANIGLGACVYVVAALCFGSEEVASIKSQISNLKYQMLKSQEG